MIWDPLVRIFHWSFAALILLNYWALEEGEDVHRWVGYTIAALLLVRVVWGFCGSVNARFASFVPTPQRLRHYWRQLRERRVDPRAGHNPLGALMIFFLLFATALCALSGWMQTLDAFWGEDWVQTLHEISAHVLMAAAAVHVIAVLVMQRLTGIGLIAAMITGRRPLP